MKTMVRLCEAIFDITLTAQWMIDHGDIEVENSRELYDFVCSCAVEFERTHPDDWDDGKVHPDNWDKKKNDYILTIDDFAEKKLLERYGNK